MSDDIDRVRIYGDPVLRKNAEKITDFDKSLRDLADRMVETMYAKNGIGLAGPQVGVSRKISVIDISFGEEVDKILTLVNPEVLESEGTATKEEGCLSVPGIFEDVIRSEMVKIRFQDLSGEGQEMEVEGFLARIIQHEVDHLDGVLFIDRLSTVMRTLLSKKLRQLTSEGDRD